MTRGIDIRESAGQIVFRVSLKDGSGAKVTSGTTELRLYRLEDDGTLDVYDWTTNDFVAIGAGTPDDETTMTHRTRRDSSGADVSTGIWTTVLSTLTNFARGQVYICQVTNSSASPESQEREFQFGGVEGDAADVEIASRSVLSIGSTTTFTVTNGQAVAVGDVLAIFFTSTGAVRAVGNGTYSAAKLLTLSAAPASAIQGTDTVTIYPVAAAVSDGSLTSASFADGCLTAAKFADGAFTAAKFGASAITSTVLADNAITAAKIAADAITDAKVASDVTIASVTGAVGSVTGNVGGNVTGSVGSVAAGGITAASIATDAIGADEISAGAVTKIQSGLATSGDIVTLSNANTASFITVNSTLGTIVADTNELQADWANGGRLDLILDTAAAASGLDAAGVRSAIGLASANLDTQLAALPTAAGIADAVWDEATSGHATSGTYGASVLIIGVSYTHTSSGSGGAATATITRA